MSLDCWPDGEIMMTSSNGNIFRVTGPLCGEFTGPGGFPAQRPVTRSFDVFFDLRLNKRLSKQPWGWWFETPSWSLWRHCNDWDQSQWVKTAASAIFYHSSFLLANPIGCAQRTDWVIQNVSQRCLCKYSCQQDPFVTFISRDITIWLVKLVWDKQQYHCFVIELKIVNKGTCYRFG